MTGSLCVDPLHVPAFCSQSFSRSSDVLVFVLVSDHSLFLVPACLSLACSVCAHWLITCCWTRLGYQLNRLSTPLPPSPVCESTSLCSDLLHLVQFLPVAISYKQWLLLPSPCHLPLRNTRFIFSVLFYTIHHVPFLCRHPALLSGSHFPSRDRLRPIPDGTALCKVRIGMDHFCSIAQDKTKPAQCTSQRAEHFDWACTWPRPKVWQISLPSYWGIVHLILNSPIKWNMCHNDMVWTWCLQTYFQKNISIVMTYLASSPAREFWLNIPVDLTHLGKQIQCHLSGDTVYHCQEMIYNCIIASQKYSMLCWTFQPLTSAGN